MGGLNEFQKQISERGYYIFPEFISHGLVLRMIADLEDAYTICRQIQVENGLDKTEGTCHHILGLGSSFMDCLVEYEKLDKYFTEYFCGKYILNSFGGNLLSKGMSYANDIHRDIRSFSASLPLMLNTLVMLDDFTEENGATWLMDGGHLYKGKPSEEEFNKYAFQITGKAGSVAVWNSNLWHRAGVNATDKPRRSLTPELTRPFMKQGFDYCSSIGEENIAVMPDYLRQVLGFYSRTSSTLQAWYQPENMRMYRSGQG